jgi:hypothetical protein
VCGIHENEEADDLKRAGLGSAFVGPEPCLPFWHFRVSSGESGCG